MSSTWANRLAYPVGLLFGDDKEEAQRAKDDLGNAVGGHWRNRLFPQSLQDVDEIAAEIARDIRHQYTIAIIHEACYPEASGLCARPKPRIMANCIPSGTSKGYYPRREIEQKQKMLHVEPIQPIQPKQ